MAGPAYSITWPVPPAVPIWAIVPRIMSFAVQPGAELAAVVDQHRLRPPLDERLGGQHVLDLAAADAERQRAEGAVGGRVRVAADDRHARLGDAQLRPDDVDDSLVAVAQRVEPDVELGAVPVERGQLLLGQLVDVVDRRWGRCGRLSPACGRAGGPGARPAAGRRTPGGWSPRGAGAGRRTADRRRSRGRPRPSRTVVLAMSDSVKRRTAGGVAGRGYGPIGEQLPSLPPADRRGAARDLAGAVLRPRVRVRGDAAQPSAARPPDAARRPADAVPAAGRLVGLDLHDVDDQLVRPRLRARAAGAAAGDGSQPADVGRHPRGVRRPGAAVRLLVRGAPAGAQRVQRLRHPEGP